MKRLGQLENAGDFRGVLNLLEDLSSQCPSCAAVHTSKCNVLCKLQRWSEAKECAEEFICNAHITIQKLTAHNTAVLPCPTSEKLIWVEKVEKIEKKGENSNINNQNNLNNNQSNSNNSNTNLSTQYSVVVDVSAVVQAVLCMGPDLGRAYLACLKNIDTCPNCCSDVMTHVQLVLTDLSIKLTKKEKVNNLTDKIDKNNITADIDPLWMWVNSELKCSKDSVHWKDIGDKQFRTNNLSEAVLAYTHAINSDPQAVKWSAVLFK